LAGDFGWMRIFNKFAVFAIALACHNRHNAFVPIRLHFPGAVLANYPCRLSNLRKIILTRSPSKPAAAVNPQIKPIQNP
jgi:hypothetical protein